LNRALRRRMTGDRNMRYAPPFETCITIFNPGISILAVSKLGALAVSHPLWKISSQGVAETIT
jgi:hypothetical protein